MERKKNPNLWKHCQEHHNGEIANFKYKMHRSFHRDSLLRQIEEVDSLEHEEGSILNDKLEFVQPFTVQAKAWRMGF